jgi:hypothetical protein
MQILDKSPFPVSGIAWFDSFGLKPCQQGRKVYGAMYSIKILLPKEIKLFSST